MQSVDIEILLATYNGERFLREQIDSILDQDYLSLRILASDDGSCDGTWCILEEYANRFPERVQLLPKGIATGHPKWNFLRLMKASTSEYLAFSDQDDVWIPEKISLTMKEMRRFEKEWGKETPLLVFTDLQVVDEKLQILNSSFWKRAGLQVDNISRLHYAVAENVVTGCTAVINRSMCGLALEMPEEAAMHDGWIALLSAVFGKATALKHPTVLYRQHSSNAIGSKIADNSVEGIKFRIRENSNRRRERLKRERQVEALLRLYGTQMGQGQRELLERYLQSGRNDSAWKRVGMTLRYGFYRAGLLRNIATILDLYKARSID